MAIGTIILSRVATDCTPGRFNQYAPLQEVSNDLGIVIRTISGELHIIGSTTTLPSHSSLNDAATLLLSNHRAYAAVYRSEESDEIVTWGEPDYGGGETGMLDIYKAESPQIQTMLATESGFAALLSMKLPGELGKTSPLRKRRIVSWGDKGGGIPSTLSSAPVESLHSTPQGFAAVIHTSREVVTWGHCDTMGETPPLMGIQVDRRPLTALVWADAYCAGKVLAASQLLALGGAIEMRLTRAPPNTMPTAAVAVTPQGRFWGWATDGILSPPTSIVNKRYRAIEATSRAFAAVTDAGGIVAWGDVDKGGRLPQYVAEHVSTKGGSLYSTLAAFAILMKDGGVSIWGDASQGGGFQIDGGVLQIVSTDTAFALLLHNATVMVVGGDASMRATWWLQRVVKLKAGKDTFMAQQIGGRIVTWGATKDAIPPRCQDCPAGRWSSGSATHCNDCAQGYWSEVGSINCQPCTFGICQRYILGAILGLIALLFIFCAICLCDVTHDGGLS